MPEHDANAALIDAAPRLLRTATPPASQGDLIGSENTRSSPGLHRHELGQTLRQLREDRGLRLEDVALALGVAPSTLSRIETGKAPTRSSYLTVLLNRYGIADPDQQRQLADLAREGHRESWWADCKDLLPAGLGRYLDLEATASAICLYAAQTIPSLLQTADYARALTRLRRPDLSPQQVHKLANLQLRRQEVLRHNDPAVRMVIDEAAQRRVIGSQRVMTAQYEDLIATASTPAPTIRIATLDRPCAALSPSLTILRFTRQAQADITCHASVKGQILLSRRASDGHAARTTLETLSRSALASADAANLIRYLAARE
jgi:transcriptional regulator with XRE-family HTH domain